MTSSTPRTDFEVGGFAIISFLFYRFLTMRLIENWSLCGPIRLSCHPAFRPSDKSGSPGKSLSTRQQLRASTETQIATSLVSVMRLLLQILLRGTFGVGFQIVFVPHSTPAQGGTFSQIESPVRSTNGMSAYKKRTINCRCFWPGRLVALDC